MQRSRILIVLGFLGTILVGAFLMMLPAASPSRTWMAPMDALFTSCSAVCITGLSVIDPGTQLSRFGQCVLLALVQLGCAGIMTVGTFFLVVAGRRLSLANEFSIVNAYGASGVRGWRGLVLWVVLSMLAIELLGMVLLHVALPSLTWYRAYFYAVMAFCNAGFSLDPGSLAAFQGKPAFLLSMEALAILGGLGFLVIYNLCTIQFWRRNLVKRGRLSLHARVVLWATFLLLFAMFAFVLALEWGRALEPYTFVEKCTIALFQAIAPRTCGFTVLPVQDLHPATRFVTEVLMFIGTGPGAAGGGIKVTTLAVLAVTLIAICRGQREVVMFKRSISEAIVRKAIVIVMVFTLMIALGMTILLVSEGGNEKLPFESLLFETVSAVSTTGLSLGSTTSNLSTVGRVVIMLCMFCGRLGALAVVLLIAGQEERLLIRYPKEELVVG